MTNQEKFRALVAELEQRGERLQVEDGVGTGYLWVTVFDRRRDKPGIGGWATRPGTKFHKEGDWPLTDEGIEQMYAWLAERLPELAAR